MQTGRASRTALRVAHRRAVHQVLDQPCILHDPIAVPLLGPEFAVDHERESHPVAKAFRAFMAARSRFAEDELAAAAEKGVSQYVVLGAGLGTFAYRNTNRNLCVFEVDFPATQEWKRILLDSAGIALPSNLTFVPLDFERKTLMEGLSEAGLNMRQPRGYSRPIATMGKSMIRQTILMPLVAIAFLTGCGYHRVGAATHTEAYHTEVALTDAVVREFADRSRMRVLPSEGGTSDVVLHGTILKEVVAPLTYNTTTQQSSSFLITLVISVTLTDRGGKVLYENKNYVFRGQYQSTTDLPTFLDESPAAVERISRDFARALVADVMEGL
jgi:outer membrane lipopolysaccharide assembly protein LptE/RlpB